jgi:hypothetical protein
MSATSRINIGIKISQKEYRAALNVKLSDKATLKIQTALDSELSRIRSAPPKPIMTLPEIADYLRMNPEIIEENLGDIPCFEFAGKLLFRKEAVDEWIKIREENYAGEVIDFNLRNSLKITIA